MSLYYQDPSMSHDQAIRFLASHQETNIVGALVSIGLNEEDLGWAQSTCLEHLEHNSESVKAAAVTAIGHLARRHGKLDMEIILSALDKVKRTSPSLAAIVADTLDDIGLFI
ncbi:MULTISPECIES: hypothetical protein [unclassified Pseudomonas]|uniref:HEAT repeat domain-containing protein n=1 Tax=Pseudomonas sp. MYb327 TaxID=2745230 RepID=A0AAU8E831_9PSED